MRKVVASLTRCGCGKISQQSFRSLRRAPGRRNLGAITVDGYTSTKQSATAVSSGAAVTARHAPLIRAEEGTVSARDEATKQIIRKIEALADKELWKRLPRLLISAKEEQGTALSDEVYAAAAKAVERDSTGRGAMELLTEMKLGQLPKNDKVYNHAIFAVCMAGDYGHGLALLAEMNEAGLQANDLSYNAVIAACGKAEKYHEALDVLSDMMEKTQRMPKEGSFYPLIAACCKQGHCERARLLLANMSRAGFRPNERAYSAVLNACSKSLSREAGYETALKVLADMMERRMMPAGQDLRVVINACCQAGQYAIARQQLSLMLQAGLRPEGKLYTQLVVACCKAGQLEEALGVLADMASHRCDLNLICYNTVLDACWKAGEVEAGLELVLQLHKAGVRPPVMDLLMACCNRPQPVSVSSSSLSSPTSAASSSSSSLSASSSSSSSSSSPPAAAAAASLPSPSAAAAAVVEAASPSSPQPPPLAESSIAPLPSSSLSSSSSSSPPPVVPIRLSIGQVMGRLVNAGVPLSIDTYVSVLKSCCRVEDYCGASDALCRIKTALFGTNLNGSFSGRLSGGGGGSGSVHISGGAKGKGGKAGSVEADREVKKEKEVMKVVLDVCGTAGIGRVEGAVELLVQALAYVRQETVSLSAADKSAIARTAGILLLTVDTTRVPADPHPPQEQSTQYDQGKLHGLGTSLYKQEGRELSPSIKQHTHRQRRSLERYSQGKVGGAYGWQQVGEPGGNTTLQQLGQLLLEMRAAGLQLPKRAVFRAALALCGRLGYDEEAAALLEDMKDRGIDPTAAYFNFALEASAKAFNFNRALGLLQDMCGAGFKPWHIDYQYAIIACGDDIDSAVKLIEAMKAAGTTPDQRCYNAALCVCRQGGHAEEAIQLLQDMRADGVMPDISSYIAAVGACSSDVSGAGTLVADSLLIMMEEDGVMPDSQFYKAIISIWNKSGNFESVLDLLGAMRTKGDGSAVDRWYYETAIYASSKAGKCELALDLLAEMKLAGWTADEVMYSTVMCACGQRGKYKEACALLKHMQQQPTVTPTTACYNFALTACEVAGQYTEALAVLTDMKRLGLTRTQRTYVSVITTCSQAGETDMAWGLLEQMRQDGLTPGIACYSAIVEGLDGHNDLQSADALYREVLETGLATHWKQSQIKEGDKAMLFGKEEEEAVVVVDLTPFNHSLAMCKAAVRHVLLELEERDCSHSLNPTVVIQGCGLLRNSSDLLAFLTDEFDTVEAVEDARSGGGGRGGLSVRCCKSKKF